MNKVMSGACKAIGVLTVIIFNSIGCNENLLAAPSEKIETPIVIDTLHHNTPQADSGTFEKLLRSYDGTDLVHMKSQI